MGIMENSANQVSDPEMQGNPPRAASRPAHEPPDANPEGSRDPRECGNNGNPAQSAGRPTAQQKDANPLPLNEESPETEEA